MKKLVVLLFAVMLGSTKVVALNDNPNVTIETQKLRNRIVALLESPEIEVENDALTAQIEFTLNDKGEIVVLTVDAENTSVEAYVKYRLNYKKVDLGNAPQRPSYKFSLKINSPK